MLGRRYDEKRTGPSEDGRAKSTRLGSRMGALVPSPLRASTSRVNCEALSKLQEKRKHCFAALRSIHSASEHLEIQTIQASVPNIIWLAVNTILYGGGLVQSVHQRKSISPDVRLY